MGLEWGVFHLKLTGKWSLSPAHQRPELRAKMPKIPTIAPKLAAEFIANLGLACIRISPLAGHPNFSRIIHVTDDDARAKGVRLRLITPRHADKVVAEILAADRRSRVADAGLVIEADVAEAERAVRHVAGLNGYRLLDDAAVDAARGRVTAKVAETIDRMQAAGQLRQINQAYKAAAGPSRPPYSAFLAGHLRDIVRVSPAEATVYLRELF